MSRAKLSVALWLAALTAPFGCASKPQEVHHPVSEEPLELHGVSTDSTAAPSSAHLSGSGSPRSAFTNPGEISTDQIGGVPAIGSGSGNGGIPAFRLARAISVSRAVFSVSLDTPRAGAGVDPKKGASWNGDWADDVQFAAPADNKMPSIDGVKASSAAYGFRDDRLVIIQADFKGAGPCRKLQRFLESRNHFEPAGPNILPPPPALADTPMFTWDDTRTTLDFHAWYTSKNEAKDKCWILHFEDDIRPRTSAK
jgi:hypothetical protein